MRFPFPFQNIYVWYLVFSFGKDCDGRIDILLLSFRAWYNWRYLFISRSEFEQLILYLLARFRVELLLSPLAGCISTRLALLFIFFRLFLMITLSLIFFRNPLLESSLLVSPSDFHLSIIPLFVQLVRVVLRGPRGDQRRLDGILCEVIRILDFQHVFEIRSKSKNHSYHSYLYFSRPGVRGIWFSVRRFMSSANISLRRPMDLSSLYSAGSWNS